MGPVNKAREQVVISFYILVGKKSNVFVEEG